MIDATIGDLETVHQPAAASTPGSGKSKRLSGVCAVWPSLWPVQWRHGVLGQRLLPHTDFWRAVVASATDTAAAQQFI